MTTFKTQRMVEFRDTDAAGILHFTSMFAYMESVEHEYLRSLGMSVKMDHEHNGTLSWPRVAAQCDYQGPVKFEDLLDIELSIERMGSKSVTYLFDIRCKGRAVAEGKLTSVCCRMTHDGPVGIEIPQDIRDRLE